MLKSTGVIFCLALTAVPAAHTLRDDRQPQPPKPSCDSREHRQFDFWLGEWEVTTPDGKPAGRNAITLEMNGCVVHERWSGVGGMKGESFNMWDRVGQRWHQTWVTDRGNLLQLDGSFDNGVDLDDRIRRPLSPREEVTHARTALTAASLECRGDDGVPRRLRTVHVCRHDRAESIQCLGQLAAHSGLFRVRVRRCARRK
jgi:hypothetical protein